MKRRLTNSILIVSNGKRYRIKLEDGTYVQNIHFAGPDGTDASWNTIFETRFHWRAKRRLLLILNQRIKTVNRHKSMADEFYPI